MSISNNDLFDLLKQNKIDINSIEHPTDEMLWWCVKNNVRINNHILSEDMILYLLSNGKSNFDTNQLNYMQVPETVWIDYIKNTTLSIFMVTDKVIQYILESNHITENVAMALCLKSPLFYTHENIKNHIPEHRKHEISDVFFNGIKNNAVKWHCELPEGLPISDEQWQWICGTKYLECCTNRVKHYIQYRNDVPDFVRHNILASLRYLNEWGPITSDDLIIWIETHKDKIGSDYGCDESIKHYIKCNDMASVLKKHGWFIKYWKNQSAKLCKAAIECDPSNIQYIKKPSDKLINYALSLDPSIRKYIKTKAEIKNQYPADNYLVKFHTNLCDEDDILKICIIKGKDMNDFMNRTTTLHFGNLDDNEEYEVKDIASYTPITDDELKVIHKFGLDDIQCGYFSNLD